MLNFLRRLFDEDVVVESQFDVLENAQQRAQNRLLEFKRRFRAEGDEHNMIFRIKVAFPVEEAGDVTGAELLEMDVLDWDGVVITGKVRDQPTHRIDIKQGEAIHVRESDVFDWAIIERGEGVVDGDFMDSDTVRSLTEK